MGRVIDCHPEDTECLDDKNKYNKHILNYQQCINATSNFSKLAPTDKFPYYMYACDYSAMPNPKNKTNGETFFKIWSEYVKCMKKPDWTKGDYLDIKHNNCPETM